MTRPWRIVAGAGLVFGFLYVAVQAVRVIAYWHRIGWL